MCLGSDCEHNNVDRRAFLTGGAAGAALVGSSPLLRQTRDQARRLERRLVERGHRARTFCAMRYWHPMSDAVAAEIKAWGPEQIVLLPLYPQFSTTTTASSLKDWSRAAAQAGLNVPASLPPLPS